MNKTFLQNIAQIRDPILVFSIVSYASGYLIWSFHMWQGGIGFVPALDPQYFIAGILPTVLLLLVLIAVTKGRKFTSSFCGKLAPDATGKWRKARNSAKIVFYSCVVIWLIAGVFYSGEKISELTMFIIQVICMPLGVFMVLLVPDMFISQRRNDAFTRLLRKFDAIYRKSLSYYLLISFAILAVVLYSLLLYPQIPQELGGIKPKPALLELRSATFSDQLLEQLSETSVNSEIVRTVEVDILFYSSNRLVVRQTNEDGHKSTYDLKRDDVETIIWLD